MEMNMLIIGACFALALLAFLGALWLAYIEKQDMLAKAIAQPEKKTVVATIPKTPPLVNGQETLGNPLSNPALRIPVAKESRGRISSGQLLELAMELRSLRTQAGAINERLRLMSVMVEEQLEQTAISPLGDLREEMAV
jgi:hypothetical protein